MNAVERLVRKHVQGKPTRKGTLRTCAQRDAYWQRMEEATKEQRERDDEARRQSLLEAQNTMLD